MDCVVTCFSCGTKTAFAGTVSREATCETCRAYLHCCRNCRFYDTAAYNECREPMAERVVDKEAANFCDYFVPVADSEPARIAGAGTGAKEALDKLFKKN